MSGSSDTTWRKLNELFAAALSREGDTAQLEFIRRASNGDPQIQAAGEELLRASRAAQARGFLSANALRAGALAFVENETATSFAGRCIGDYRIVREIARGGMGTVFLAERQQFKQRVALKVIKRGMDTDEIVRRFERERQVLAELNHPNIARLLDGGTTPDGLPYFVMEYVDGKPITAFCDEKRLSIDERLRLFQKLCAAVAHIHRRSIIHRDIKPSNAVIDNEGEPKLLDFGIAKLLASAADAQSVTAAEPRLLTPQYASPEQLRGERLTKASDIYSLGMLLYELLSGHRPFRAASTSASELARTEAEREPRTPSSAAATTEEIEHEEGPKEVLSPAAVARLRKDTPERLRRRLRGDLDNVTLKALDRAPERRYATVEELSADLGRHLAGLPVVARPATVAYRAAKLLRRRPTAVLALTACVLGTAALTETWLRFRREAPARTHAVAPPPATTSIAVLPFKNLSGNPERDIFTDGLTESLIGSLAKIESLKVISRNSVSAFKGKDVDPRVAGRELHVANILEGSVRGSGDTIQVDVRLVSAANGEIIWSGGNHERSLGDIFAIQEDIARATVAQLRLKLTPAGQERLTTRQTNSVAAHQAYVKGRDFWKRKDRANLERSKRFFEEAIRLDPNYALAYDGLADYHFNSIWYAGASQSEAAAKGKAAVLKVVELAPGSPEAHDGLARVAASEGDWQTYRKEQEKAVALAPNDASIWHNYAFSLRHRPEEALAAIRHAQELDPLSPSISTDVGAILGWNKRWDEAIAVYQDTIEAYPDFPSVYWNLRYACEAKGLYAEAVAAYIQSRRLEGDSEERVARYQSAFEQAGYEGFRRQHLEFLLAEADKEQNTYWIAAEYAFLREKEQTLEWLEKAVAVRHFMIGSIDDEEYAFLRGDSRYEELLRRVGLQN